MISKNVLGLIKGLEGCRLTAYQDVRGVWTIGYGHTGPEVHSGLVWTQAQADAALTMDIQSALAAARRLCHRALSDDQLAAFTSLIFNVGQGNVSGSRTLAVINDGRWLDAVREWIGFDHTGGVEDKGLLIRRLEECTVFLKGT